MIKFRSPFSKTRIDPKPAVPTDITEQYPWHWNPQETNHNDANGFVGKVDFDWKGLAEWSIDFCNRDLTPQKW